MGTCKSLTLVEVTGTDNEFDTWEDRATQLLHSWADETLTLQNSPVSLWVGVSVFLLWSEFLFLPSRKLIFLWMVEQSSSPSFFCTWQSSWLRKFVEKTFLCPLKDLGSLAKNQLTHGFIFRLSIQFHGHMCLSGGSTIMSRFSCGSGVIQPTAELTFLKQLLCFFSDHALHFNVSLDIRDSNILSYVPSKTDR